VTLLYALAVVLAMDAMLWLVALMVSPDETRAYFQRLSTYPLAPADKRRVKENLIINCMLFAVAWAIIA
jgi:hypothetical protein